MQWTWRAPAHRPPSRLSILADLWVAEVDSGQIVQVLHNILLNARQSMPEGGIIEVHAENVILAGAQGAANRVRISIRDFGCGIPVDVLPRIFDPYFTTKPGGRGLGLATAYAIIAKHGGSLSVESRPGYGTVFTIDLPASQSGPAPQVPMVSRNTSRYGANTGNGRRRGSPGSAEDASDEPRL